MAVLMTSGEFIQRAEALAARPSFYSNKYPYNLCYIHPDGRTSADCWNLYKAILNGYDVTKTTPGYFQKDLRNTGDVDGATLMSKCSDVSVDFTKLKEGEPRLLYMPGHAGAFIGYRQRDGHAYNVIECTGSWERKILYSWVDPDGTRRRWKDGAKNGRWAKHGKMTKWVNYTTTQEPAPSKPDNPSSEPVNSSPKKTNEQIAKEVLAGKWGNGEDRKKRLAAAGYNYTEVQKIVNEMAKKPSQSPVYTVEYTVKAGDTLTAIAQRNGTTVPAIMALNPQIKDANKIRTGQVIRIK